MILKLLPSKLSKDGQNGCMTDETECHGRHGVDGLNIMCLNLRHQVVQL